MHSLKEELKLDQQPVNVSDHANESEGLKDKIKVAIRVRPLLKKDFGKEDVTIIGKDK